VDGKSIGRLSVGRISTKVPTYGPGTYAGTGTEPISYYGLTTTQTLDPTKLASA